MIHKNLIIDHRDEVPYLMTKIPSDNFSKNNIINKKMIYI